MGFHVIKNDELYHHGILGMKWGKRNGPPYPLGASDHSSSEKTAGWQKSLDKSKKSNTTRKSIDSAIKKQNTINESEPSVIVAQRIARNIKLDLLKDRVSSIKMHGQKATDIYSNMQKTAVIEAEQAISSTTFKNDLLSRLYDNFGVGSDDKEYFDIVRDEIGLDMLMEEKYSPKTNSLAKDFRKEVDSFASESSKLVDNLIDDIGGDSKIKNTSYKDIVEAYVRNETGSSWVSYLSRHENDYVWMDNEGIPYDFSAVITMDKYNQKNGKN